MNRKSQRFNDTIFLFNNNMPLWIEKALCAERYAGSSALETGVVFL